MRTVRCPATALVNISPALVGIVVLRGMMTFVNPPNVSMPKDSGVTSSKTNATHRPGEDARLDRRADGDGFIGVLRRVRFASENLRHGRARQRHSRGTTDQDDRVEFTPAPTWRRPKRADNVHGCVR